jgi:hypothetical protein
MKVAIYMLVLVGVPILASVLLNETARSILAISYLFLVIPYGIVKSIEYYRTNLGNSAVSRTFNVIFRVPLGLFGMICLLGGFSIMGWVLYNVFIHREKEYTGPRVVTGLSSFGVGVPLVVYGYATLRSVFRRQEEIVLDAEDITDNPEADDHEDERPR